MRCFYFKNRNDIILTLKAFTSVNNQFADMFVEKKTNKVNNPPSKEGGFALAP